MPGFYGTQPLAPCQLCPLNYYCPGNLSLQACMPNASSVAGQFSKTACSCNPGFFFNATTEKCIGCSPGSYCAGGLSPMQTCKSNSYSPPFASLASHCTCNAGFYGDAATMCIACPTGTYTTQTNTLSKETGCIACVQVCRLLFLNHTKTYYT